jgi:hypothetical protein
MAHYGEGTRIRGGLVNRGTDKVEKKVGIRSCYTVARDWKEWRRFVLEAKRQWTIVLELAYDG